VVLTNFSSRAVSANLTTVGTSPNGAPDSGSTAGTNALTSQRLTVPPGGQVDVPPSQLGQAGALAASVVLDGGGVGVSEVVSSPLGWSMTPCASSTAPQWYFAHGATFQGGGLVLSLFNPGSTDAAVNIALATSTAGYLVPPAFQGVGVPAHALVTENIGDHVADDSTVATVVSTLSGTVVAAELQSVGRPGNGGVAVTLGAASPSPQWTFAQNTNVTGGKVAFHVFNPSTRATTVSISIGLPQGAGAEPLSLSVPGQSVATLEAQNETRIPANTPYAATFTSAGAPIVVARQVTSPTGAPASEPAVGDAHGVAGGRSHWLVPAVAPPGNGAWAFAVVDLGRRPAKVRVANALGGVLAGQSVQVVRPGTPLFIGPNPGAPFGTAPFRLDADQPVALELDAVPVASPGVVVVPALASG
jgi:hypothetical protein